MIGETGVAPGRSGYTSRHGYLLGHKPRRYKKIGTAGKPPRVRSLNAYASAKAFAAHPRFRPEKLPAPMSRDFVRKVLIVRLISGLWSPIKAGISHFPGRIP